MTWLECFACNGWFTQASLPRKELAKMARGHIERRHPDLVEPFRRAFTDEELFEFMSNRVG